MDEDFQIDAEYTSKDAAIDCILVRVDQHGEPLINFFSRKVWDLCIFSQAIKLQHSESELIAGLKSAVIRAIILSRKRVQLIPAFNLFDWFYKFKINGWEFYLGRNETGGYTLCFPEEFFFRD